MATRNKLVNLFVLGVQKGGTTYIADLLSQQPDFFLPSIKETYFFAEDSRFEKGEGWFHREFYLPVLDDWPAYALDATPFYYCNPAALERIKAYGGEDTRYIMVIRDPVDRAYSAYWHQRRLNLEPLSFADALGAEEDRIAEAIRTGDRWWRQAYVTCGLYGEHLARTSEILGRQDILVLTSAMSRDEAMLRGVLSDFLGREIRQPTAKADQNSAAMPRFRSFHRMFTSDNVVKRLAGAIVPREVRTRIARRLMAMNLREFRYPPMDAEIRRSLRARFRPDLDKLLQIEWLNPTTREHVRGWRDKDD